MTNSCEPCARCAGDASSTAGTAANDAVVDDIWTAESVWLCSLYCATASEGLLRSSRCAL